MPPRRIESDLWLYQHVNKCEKILIFKYFFPMAIFCYGPVLIPMLDIRSVPLSNRIKIFFTMWHPKDRMKKGETTVYFPVKCPVR